MHRRGREARAAQAEVLMARADAVARRKQESCSASQSRREGTSPRQRYNTWMERLRKALHFEKVDGWCDEARAAMVVGEAE